MLIYLNDNNIEQFRAIFGLANILTQQSSLAINGPSTFPLVNTHASLRSIS